jgi:hypothetical protein
MSAAADTPRRPASPGRPARPRSPIAAVLALESVTLAVFSTLHLTGALRIGTGGSDGAGVAEAVICVVLVGGAWALARSPSPARARRAGLFAVCFAIAGFIVGLTFTVDSGEAIDLIYHATMLPILVGTAVLVARRVPTRHL